MKVPVLSLGTLSIEWDSSYDYWDGSVFIEIKEFGFLLDLIAFCCGGHKVSGWNLFVPGGYEFLKLEDLEHFCFVARIAYEKESCYYYSQV
jgi:hypothetical protein